MIPTRLLSCLSCAVLLTHCGSTKPVPVERGTVSVKVGPTFKNVPVRISVYAPKDGKHGPEIESHVVKADGMASFVLPIGPIYEIRAFADLNQNGKPDPNEPTGILEGVKPDPDLHSAQAPLTLTLSAPSGAAVPAEAPDKKRGTEAAAPVSAGDAAGSAAPKPGADKSSEASRAGPVPPPPP